MIFQQKLLEKGYCFVKMTGPAGQFWLLESALSLLSLSGGASGLVTTLLVIKFHLYII